MNDFISSLFIAFLFTIIFGLVPACIGEPPDAKKASTFSVVWICFVFLVSFSLSYGGMKDNSKYVEQEKLQQAEFDDKWRHNSCPIIDSVCGGKVKYLCYTKVPALGNYAISPTTIVPARKSC